MLGDEPPAAVEAERIRQLVLASREAEALAAIELCLHRWSHLQPDESAPLADLYALRGSVLLRQGHHLSAMQAFGTAAARQERLGRTFEHVFALTQLGAALSSLGLHAQGVQAASVATELALSHGLRREAAQALMGLGLCSVLMGNAFLGERYVVEALGIALAENDERVLTYSTINVVYILGMLADECRANQQPELAEQALARGVRHVHRGDKLGLSPGTFDQALWQSNKAGWLWRRGSIDEAQALYLSVVEAARQSAWVEIERHAAFGLGGMARARGDALSARHWWLRCIDSGTEHDAYRVVERAHGHLALAFADTGDAGQAQRHRVSATLLQRQADVRRASALQAVRQLDAEVLMALAQADARRLDAELARLHPTMPTRAATPSTQPD